MERLSRHGTSLWLWNVSLEIERLNDDQRTKNQRQIS